ncbi:MAG: hypothetical protein K5872_04400 [Rhizobiaceae bacterium]|nr:hypothetical protein [Rhizobiaceae bacterium]MCV0405452.1 hypothetical protein [Rhizobiaceae bacterium]
MNVVDLDSRFENLKRAFRASEEKLEKLAALNDEYGSSGSCLIVNGSLARKELVDGSDFDSFVVQAGRAELANELSRKAYEIAGLKEPGSSGIFGNDSTVLAEEMLRNIGGMSDSNEKITQRMLLILESAAFGDMNIYNNLVDSMLARYISDKITDHQLGLFLLNDVIRYYRTICVDFEFKTEEGRKPWGIRNIKLVFSRKLIYFSGLIICAEMGQRTAAEKRSICRRLLSLTPIERMLVVLREDALEPLAYYDKFLEKMSDKDIREQLKSEDREKLRSSELFRSLKNDGHHFTWALRSAFNRHYDSTHPIHKAIMF